MGQIQPGAMLLCWQMGLDPALDAAPSSCTGDGRPPSGSSTEVGTMALRGETLTHPPRPDSVLLASGLIEEPNLHLSITSVSLPGTRLSRDAGAGHEPGTPTSSNAPPGPHRDPHLPVSPAPRTENGCFMVPRADNFVSP